VPEIPVILSTGFSRFFTHEEARAAGISEVVTNYLHLPQLSEFIKNVLKIRNMETEQTNERSAGSPRVGSLKPDHPIYLLR
jgi:DNA-binding NtrC family response regulator